MLAVVLPGGGACSAGGVGVVSGPAVRLRSAIAAAVPGGPGPRAGQRHPGHVGFAKMLDPAGAFLWRQDAAGVDLGFELGQERRSGLGGRGGSVGLSGPLLVGANLGA